MKRRLLLPLVILELVASVLSKSTARTASVSRLSNGRIVGGETTTIEAHPFQISLRYGSSHRCGGAIVSEYFVISAAHCFYELSSSPLSLWSIRAGSSYRTIGGTLHDLSYYTYHDLFRDSTYDYDIALIKVRTPFQFGPTVQPIELPPSDFAVEDGTMVGVSGWGRLSYGGIQSSVLQVVEVPVINNTYCGELYAYANVVTERMICAGFIEGGKDACQGDSGGPLFYGNTLIGIVSWGDECAVARQPGVYGSVSNLRDWILEKTGFDFF